MRRIGMAITKTLENTVLQWYGQRIVENRWPKQTSRRMLPGSRRSRPALVQESYIKEAVLNECLNEED